MNTSPLLSSSNMQKTAPAFFAESREPERDQSIPIHFSYVDLTQTNNTASDSSIEGILNPIATNNVDPTGEEQARIIHCMTLKLASSADITKIKNWLKQQNNTTALWSYHQDRVIIASSPYYQLKMNRRYPSDSDMKSLNYTSLGGRILFLLFQFLLTIMLCGLGAAVFLGGMLLLATIALPIFCNQNITDPDVLHSVVHSLLPVIGIIGSIVALIFVVWCAYHCISSFSRLDRRGSEMMGQLLARLPERRYFIPVATVGYTPHNTRQSLSDTALTSINCDPEAKNASFHRIKYLKEDKKGKKFVDRSAILNDHLPTYIVCPTPDYTPQMMKFEQFPGHSHSTGILTFEGDQLRIQNNETLSSHPFSYLSAASNLSASLDSEEKTMENEQSTLDEKNPFTEAINSASLIDEGKLFASFFGDPVSYEIDEQYHILVNRIRQQ